MDHATLSMPYEQVTIALMNELGELIRIARERSKFATQRDFADAIQKDPSWVSRLERGLIKETPTPQDMNHLAQALLISQSDMLKAAGYDLGDQGSDPRSDAVRHLSPIIDRYVWQHGDIDRIARVIQSLGEMREGTFDVPHVEE